jgi:hypothetical protein
MTAAPQQFVLFKPAATDEPDAVTLAAAIIRVNAGMDENERLDLLAICARATIRAEP